MKTRKDVTELKSFIQETVNDTVKEVLREKTDAFRALPVSGQIGETFKAFCTFSAESAKLFLTVAECLGVFFTLVYAVRELIKEIKSPL